MSGTFNQCVGDKIREPVMEHHHTMVVRPGAGLSLERFDEERWDLGFGELVISLSDDQLRDLVGSYLDQQGMDEALELVHRSWGVYEGPEAGETEEGADV